MEVNEAQTYGAKANISLWPNLPRTKILTRVDFKSRLMPYGISLLLISTVEVFWFGVQFVLSLRSRTRTILNEVKNLAQTKRRITKEEQFMLQG